MNILTVKSGTMKEKMEVRVKDMAICRIRDGNHLIPGWTDSSGDCVGEDRKEDEYQVLVDMVGMARLEWKHWDMFTRPEIGSVAYTENMFIGRIEKNGELVIGDLDFGRGMNGDIRAFERKNKRTKKIEGEVLVEVEPVKYEVENITFHDEKEERVETNVNLGNITLISEEEDGDTWVMVKKDLFYDNPITSYWGHVPGMVRGIPTRLEGSNDIFLWGVRQEMVESMKYRVEVMMQGGTTEIRTMTGILVRRERLYTATLMIVYRDGIVRSHKIQATHSYSYIERLLETQGQPFFSQSGLPAPTTTTSSTLASPSIKSTSSRPSTTMAAVSLIKALSISTTPSSPDLPKKTHPGKIFSPANPNPLRLFYPFYEDNDSDSVAICSMYSDSHYMSLSVVCTVTVTICHYL